MWGVRIAAVIAKGERVGLELTKTTEKSVGLFQYIPQYI
jgi:hypothetical protein